MITKYENKSIMLNTDLRGLKAGTILGVPVDKDGTPLDRYWRDRLKDATKDNCIKIIAQKKTKKKNKEE